VRELHDRLSEYLQRVEEGQEVLVTRRGRPVARPSGAESRDPLAELAERGLVRLPQRPAGPSGTGEGHGAGFRSRRRAAPLTPCFDTSALVKLVVLFSEEFEVVSPRV
jgi:prevent-host-death family protein